MFGRRIDVHPKLIIPDFRAIRQAVASGFSFSVFPDYLCANSVKENRLTLFLKPAQAVTNRIWLAFRKSERQLPKIKPMLEFGKFQKVYKVLIPSRGKLNCGFIFTYLLNPRLPQYQVA
ncbi:MULTISPECIES: LysR substrate-binding domain-containing protein [unclassified Microcoleus]|uniref:LysR substrate-binding domain-containing protein n=1 Tax=unclassified Microcoleus TaxID=2642155 RepID=UPI002FD002BA